ncbi:hypothetical protein DICPUDRAFT_91206 [Dictyostelium purpureum]|uniref:PNPLA domain-containing protein n=1 Tax=Dictyostelium purpureum TaxID=5786 RepID=F0Z921_DICPU|nr:uncharacterized protein DICPUDRAFT_91206 [Dictyostelium purpureum]EGC39587.1 hypothetical protein DICPUDRAFT_91206 [Dictyostelium purpureum]|eukprot:XP_003283922.1 hypothetical protein DICPUDRAFT_91206 [Dictyostelium purpureum]
MDGANKKIKTKFFVSIDGGGIKGLMSIQIIEEIERQLEINISDADLIGGTSAGGIIAFSKMNDISSSEIADLYKSIGKNVLKFNCSNITESQSLSNTQFLITELERLFGRKNLSEFAQHRKGLVVSCLSPTPVPIDYQSFILSNYNNPHREYSEPKQMIDISVSDAIRATAGIPLLFNVPRYKGRNFLDGGYQNNNPTKIVYQEAVSLFGGAHAEDSFVFISIGAGKQVKSFGNHVVSGIKMPFEFVNNTVVPGLTGVELSSPIHRIVKFMTVASDETHQDFKKSYSHLKYFRFDPIIDRSIAVNDASDETIEYMHQKTQEYIKSSEFNEMISQLKILMK